MVDLADWTGLVDGRNDDFDELSVVAPVAGAGGSWSGPVRMIASDGRDYFVKTLDTCPPGHDASLASEMIVARAGQIIGAPMCTVSLIRIPDEIAGWEPRRGISLKAGLAHASLALDHADEYGRPRLAARSQDDNRRRHVGVYALYDWCFGSDPQWLYDLDNDRTLYSHDHGLYFPPSSKGGWVMADLVASVNTPCQLSDSSDDLLPAAIDEVASALESVDRADLVAVMNSVPSSWPVSDSDLEALGWFLEKRAPSVAQRIRRLSTGGKA